MVPPEEGIETLAAAHALHHLVVGHPGVGVDQGGAQLLLAVEVHRPHELGAQGFGARVALELRDAGVAPDAAQHVALTRLAAQDSHQDRVGRGLGLAMDLEVLVSPEQDPHGVECVTAPLCAAATEQHIAGEDRRLDLGVLVLGPLGALEDPMAQVCPQLVPRGADEVHAVHTHPVALQVLQGLLQARLAAACGDEIAALLEHPLHRDHHRLAHDDGDRTLVLFATRGNAQTLMKFLDAVAALGDLRGLLDQQNPAPALLQGLDLEDVAEVRPRGALHVDRPVHGEGRESPGDELPLDAGAADAPCEVDLARPRLLQALFVGEEAQVLPPEDGPDPTPLPTEPTLMDHAGFSGDELAPKRLLVDQLH
mmetsp:Transcript_45201/g.131536  ORF Transcript_45201/g.131536 Transcript_45201/m.131536 type:complete len:367 (-) Transcript_45201:815-1915(-)